MQANLWLFHCHDKEADAAQMSKLVKKMEEKVKATKSMQNDVQMFKSKLEILLARFDLWSKLQNDALLQNGTPVAAGGASAEPLITGAAPAELLSTRAEPCARSEAASSRKGPKA